MENDPMKAIPLTDDARKIQEEYRRLRTDVLSKIPVRNDAIRIYSDTIYQLGGDPVQRSYVDALTKRLAAAEQRADTLQNAGSFLYDRVQRQWATSGTTNDDAEAAMRLWQQAVQQADHTPSNIAYPMSDDTLDYLACLYRAPNSSQWATDIRSLIAAVRSARAALTLRAATSTERANDAPHGTDHTANHSAAERAVVETSIEYRTAEKRQIAFALSRSQGPLVSVEDEADAAGLRAAFATKQRLWQTAVDALLALDACTHTATEGAVVEAVREEIHRTIWVDEGIIGVEPAEGMPKTVAALATLDACTEATEAAAKRVNDAAQFLFADASAAEAWADDVAMFILHKITETESLTLAEITPNLTAPDGWVSFARLWRAGFIDVTGDHVQPTERGATAMREFLVCVADIVEDSRTDMATEGA